MSAGDDVFVASYTFGSETFDGGEGNDTVDYRNNPFGIMVRLRENMAHKGYYSDTLISIENIIGTFTSDHIQGDDNANKLEGLDGGDYLYGHGGDDILEGGNGLDILTGDLGNDQLFGGNDTDQLYGLEGSDTLYGGADTDVLYGDEAFIDDGSRDYLYGEDGDDFLLGDLGADVLDGGSGFDVAIYFRSTSAVSVNLATFSGSGGAATGDTLVSIEHVSGSIYNDTLSGDANANILSGNTGNDTLLRDVMAMTILSAMMARITSKAVTAMTC